MCIWSVRSVIAFQLIETKPLFQAIVLFSWQIHAQEEKEESSGNLKFLTNREF